MRAFLIVVLYFLCSCALADCESIYLKIGAGYKFHEMTEVELIKTGQTVSIKSEPISARIELVTDCNRVSFGLAHHSQYASGWPVNDEGEYHKTEIFIDVKFDIWEF